MSSGDLEQRIAEVREAFLERAAAASTPSEIEEVRVAFLGRKGTISQLFPSLGALPADGRAAAGAALNALKAEAAEQLEACRQRLSDAASDGERRAVDITLPGVYHSVGHPHLLSIVQREIEEIFLGMGFDVAVGPEIETEYHNFEALNIPAGHPAREDWDTFYISDTLLLRPHTSPVQIRVMESTEPPVRIICPGRCFRRDAQDATHSPTFFQVELLWIDEQLSLANLRYVIDRFVEAFFGPGYETRLSGDFFPFTEPSVQLHMREPGEESWLEIGGAGMVDPAVLECVGYDPETVSGFAFGFGLERMAMLKYGIRDIRTFLANDLRFIRQFRPA
ncbi:MAG: phenylalanine--tRNA ligase subunit alpha [Candidatus Bipolaricaulota bacterium]|nr:MAG: phenylalanine--tRNA ligase subunit alpha [Candidatus Bipolaricaulota bacterium]